MSVSCHLMLETISPDHSPCSLQAMFLIESPRCYFSSSSWLSSTLRTFDFSTDTYIRTFSIVENT